MARAPRRVGLRREPVGTNQSSSTEFASLIVRRTPVSSLNPRFLSISLVVLRLSALWNADGTVRLAWPVTAQGFKLEESDALGRADSWKAVTTVPTVIGDENV